MIRYSLTCEFVHDFEGWFRNSDDFNVQIEKQLICCPVCGSSDVQKKLMAPAVSTSRMRSSMPAGDGPEPRSHEQGGETPRKQQAALIPNDIRQGEILEALRTIRRRMTETSDYVGKEFPEEARRMHYGEAEQRSIYGETSTEEAQSLLDEGIEIMALPVLPEDTN